MFALLASERFLVEFLRAKDDRLVGDFAGIPEAPLPGDLRATLRAYQRGGGSRNPDDPAVILFTSVCLAFQFPFFSKSIPQVRR